MTTERQMNSTTLRIFAQATYLVMTVGALHVKTARQGRQLDLSAYENARALYRAARPFLTDERVS